MQQAHLFDNTTLADVQRKKKTNALLKVIKADDSDREWYPTDQPQIDCIKADILRVLAEDRFYREPDKIGLSMLDCGAGDGRVLMQLTDGDRYAIEQSLPLVQAMDKTIRVIGCDFHQQTLIDKKLDCLFCNAPYSEYEAWASKIILEGNAALAYLIMPQRWVNSQPIKEALAARRFKTEVIGSFDYSNADRVARAKVDIVKVNMGSLSSGRGSSSSCSNDPFDIWFATHFPLEAPESEVSSWAKKQQLEDELSERIAEGGEIIKREGLVRLLAKLYQRDLEHLMETYQTMTKIPAGLLRELEINIGNVKATLRLKVASLKDVYWHKLFDGLDSITDKLCTSSRKRLLDRLTSQTNVDFNEENAVAIVIWVLKQANEYFDSQVIEVFETLTEAANVKLYRSNERTIRNDGWRYADDRYSQFGPYGLDYRVILDGVGGYKDPGCWQNNTRCGLADNAAALVGDLVTIANNIGLDAAGNTGPLERRWLPGKPQLFYFYNHSKGKKEVLLEVKAFKNGNLHIRMNELYIQKLNTVHGRLKGWLRTAAEAAAEMDVPIDIAEEAFAVQLRLGVSDIPLLNLAN